MNEIKSKTKVGSLIAEARIRSKDMSDAETYERNTKAYMGDIEANPVIQISAKVKLSEKTALYTLIKSKGCDGLTGFLKMLASAKEVQITL